MPRYVKVRDADSSGNAVSRWVLVSEVSSEASQGPQGERGERGEAGDSLTVFEQSDEPMAAQPGDLWIDGD